MAHPSDGATAPRNVTLAQSNRIVILHHGLKELGNALRAYMAIEQLARLQPVGEDDDYPPPLEIDRNDLCQLLAHVGDAVGGKVEFLTKLAAEAQQDLLTQGA